VQDVPENVTVSCFDQYGDLFVNYTGSVSFSTDRPGKATVPGDYVFVLADAGAHTFVGGITFKDDGEFNVTVTDKDTPTVTGMVHVKCGPLTQVIDHFTVAGISDMIIKQKSNVVVTAYDQYGYVFDQYAVRYTSRPMLPAEYSRPTTHSYHRIKGRRSSSKASTSRRQECSPVTVADTVVPTALAHRPNIQIYMMTPSQTFRMYDMFEETWGEWWPNRWKGYKTDIILTNETGKYTMIYNPDTWASKGSYSLHTGGTSPPRTCRS